MAKLKKVEISEKSEDGMAVSFVSQVEVDKAGIFSATYDPDVSSSIREVAMRYSSVDMSNGRLRGKVLADIEALLKAGARYHLECEIVREFVICHVVDHTIAYVVDKDVGVVPNGRFAKKWDLEQAEWKGRLNANTEAQSYRVGFAAQVFLKKTYLRPTGSNVVYEKATASMLPEMDEILNCFVGLKLNPQGPNVRQMPYTLQAANFFHETMLSMCRMAEVLDRFFGDENRVAAAIAGTGGLDLIGSSVGRTEGGDAEG